MLNAMQQWGESDSLSLKLFTLKLMMLLSLTRPSRSADLVSLNEASTSLKVWFFYPIHWPNNLCRQGKPLVEYYFASFPDNKQLCRVDTLQQYQLAIMPLRRGYTQLFLDTVKPHNLVTSCTITWWLKVVLKMSGIDVTLVCIWHIPLEVPHLLLLHYARIIWE